MSIESAGVVKAAHGLVVAPVVADPAKAEAQKKASTSVELPKAALKEPSSAEEEKSLKEAAEKINDFIESMTTDLQFSFDKDSDKMVVKVLSRKDGEVIRQIPSKEALEIAKALDTLTGLIIRKKA